MMKFSRCDNQPLGWVLHEGASEYHVTTPFLETVMEVKLELTLLATALAAVTGLSAIIQCYIELQYNSSTISSFVVYHIDKC